MTGRRRRVGRCLATVALLSSVACGGGATDAEPTPPAPDYDDPAAAYAAVVRAYVTDDCDTAAALVDGTARGIEQFLGGCERREGVDVIRTLEVTGGTRPTSLDPLPTSVSEAVGLTAAYTAESGESTDYYPDMVMIDGRWKLWLPGDESPSPDARPSGTPSP